MSPRIVRMVPRADDPNSYREVSRSELSRRSGLILECADGCETTNTVTYWYRFATPGVDA